MSAFLDGLIDRINILWEFLLNIIRSLLEGIYIASSSVSLVTRLIAFMPSFIASSALIVVAVFVIKFIIGR